MVILTSFPPPTVGVRLSQTKTAARIGRRDLGAGTLFIAESRISWVNDSGEGFSLEYPAVSVHAVSRDVSQFPHECLYLMIDALLGTGDEAEDESEDSETTWTEIRFVPEDKGVLDAMFHAMSECQALHPDPDDSATDEDEEDDDDHSNSEAIFQVGSTRQEDNVHGNGSAEVEPMDTSQFEDAEGEHGE